MIVLFILLLLTKKNLISVAIIRFMYNSVGSLLFWLSCTVYCAVNCGCGAFACEDLCTTRTQEECRRWTCPRTLNLCCPRLTSFSRLLSRFPPSLIASEIITRSVWSLQSDKIYAYRHICSEVGYESVLKEKANTKQKLDYHMQMHYLIGRWGRRDYSGNHSQSLRLQAS